MKHFKWFEIRRSRALLFAALFVAGSVSLIVHLRKGSSQTIVIGAVLPLTGQVGQYGQFMKQGLELALDKAVADGVVKPGEVELIIEDGGGDPSKSLTAYQKLVAVDKPIAIVSALSGVILAMKPLANRDQVVMLNASSISPEIDDANDFVFSTIPNADVEGVVIAEYAFARGDRTIGIVRRNDASGTSFERVFTRRFEQLGGRVLYTEVHAPGEADYRPLIQKLKSRPEVNAIFFASYGPEVAKYLQQAKELGGPRRLLAYTTFYSPKVLEIARDAAEGVVFSAPAFDAMSDQPVARELRERVFARYKSNNSNYYIASHWDALMLLLHQIQAGAKTGKTLRDRLAQIKTFDGLTGKMSFDERGACRLPLKMYKVATQQFIPI